MSTNGSVARPEDKNHQVVPLTPLDMAQNYGSSTKILDEKKRQDNDVEAASTVGCGGRSGWCGPETRAWAVIVKLLACVLAGMVFGWSLEKARGKYIVI